MTEPWRCRQSPSGAHHWVLEWVDGATPGTREHWGTCKFCGARERQDTKRRNPAGHIVPEREEPEEEQEMTTETRQEPTKRVGPSTKHKYIMEHLGDIRRDAMVLHIDDVCAKYGIGHSTYYRLVSVRKCARLKRTELTAPPATGTVTEAIHVARGPMDAATAQHVADAVTATTGGNGHSPLPSWRDDWTEAVQVAWLEAATAIELARVVAGARRN